MPQSSAVITNFTGGEFSPRLSGRSDLAKYASACRTIENFIVQTHGGVIKRPGSSFAAKARYPDRLTRLVEFQFSVEQTYVLEMGDLYFRFYRDGGPLMTSYAITAVNTTLSIFTIAGDQTGSVGVGDTFTVTVSTANDRQYTALVVGLNGGNTEITVTPGGLNATADGQINIATTIASPYTEAQLRSVKYTQSADILYLCHNSHEPRELRRTAGNDASPSTWQLVEMDRIDGPYLEVNTTTTTLTPSATTGTITITASAATFASTDVGRSVRIQHAGAWGWAKITIFTNATTVTAGVQGTFNGASASAAWALGAWSDTTGWPAVPLFHDERLWFGATTSQPQTIFASQVGDFTNFGPSELADGSVLDTSGLVLTLADNKVNAVRWLVSDSRGLLTLTDGGPFIVQGGGDFDPITPTSLGYRRQSTDGAHPTARPHQVGSVVLATKSGGREILEIVFSYEVERFVAPDMTLLAEHITAGGIIDTAIQLEPDAIIWLVRADGQLLGLTYARDEQVIAWHRHILGGALGESHAKVEAIAAIREGDHDQLWMVVQRSIDGSDVRHIEYLTPVFEADDDQADAVAVDCSVSYGGPSEDNFSGIEHLEGETVSILADGGAREDDIVENGLIAIDPPASVVHAGLKISSRLQTMGLVPAPAGFDSRSGRKRAWLATMQLNRSLGGRIGVGDDATDPIDYRAVSDDPETPPPLFTGEKEMPLPGNHERFPVITIEHDEPTPFNLLAIIANVQVEGI